MVVHIYIHTRQDNINFFPFFFLAFTRIYIYTRDSYRDRVCDTGHQSIISHKTV